MQLARVLNTVFKKDWFILVDADSKSYIIGTPKNNNPNHLKLLAFLSRLFTNKTTLKNLRATLNEEAIYAILTNDILTK